MELESVCVPLALARSLISTLPQREGERALGYLASELLFEAISPSAVLLTFCSWGLSATEIPKFKIEIPATFSQPNSLFRSWFNLPHNFSRTLALNSDLAKSHYRTQIGSGGLARPYIWVTVSLSLPCS